MTRLAAVALVLTLPAFAFAQDRPADAEQPPVVTPPSQPVPRDDEPLQPVVGVKYSVELKTGNELIGIVRAKEVFERWTKRGGFEPADQDEDGAGLRLWFPRAQDGYIFVHVVEMKRVEELGAITADEGRAIALAQRDAKRRALAERQDVVARLAAAEAARQAEKEATAAADEAATTEEEGVTEVETKTLSAEHVALLDKYPPSRWNLETPKEIQRRKVVLGLFPSEEEKAFLEAFPQWKVAYEKWQSVKALAETPADTTKSDSATSSN